MDRASEILFIDPSVSHLKTVLGNLRPGVHAILLNERWPAARQIAAALEGREGLDAVHVIAHGAPEADDGACRSRKDHHHAVA